MVKKSAGPRLKICQNCEEPNPPRQFYCRNCNNPFYSEEVLNARARPKTPVDDSSIDTDQEEDIIPNLVPDQDIVKTVLIKFAKRASQVISKPLPTKPSLNLRILKEKKDSEPSNIELPGGNAHQWDSSNWFISTGYGSVKSVSFLSNDYLSILAENRYVQIYQIADAVMQLSEIIMSDFEGTVKSVQWIYHLNSPESKDIVGLLAVVLLDRLEVHLVPKKSGLLSKDSTLLWTLNEPGFFPSGIDAKFSKDGLFIELLTVNNLNNFTRYFRLSIGDDGSLVPVLSKMYGHNDPGRRVTEDSGDICTTGTCTAFLKTNPYMFITGFSNGLMALFDIRNDSGPINVIMTLAGIRRWLVDLVPSATDPAFVLAAYQAGSLVDLTDGDSSVHPIGGDVRTAQCWGVDSLGDRVFSAMSSGVVITMDLALREKLRRGMTGYVAAWAACATSETCRNDNLTECLISSLSKAKKYTSVTCKLFEAKQFPRNLKHLKASDGASNEPPQLIRGEANLSPVPVMCLRLSPGGLVAYGTDAGIVHIFRYSESG